MLPPDDRLTQQLLTPTYEIVKGKVKVMPKNRTEGKVCMRDLLKHSPDELDAVANLFADPDTKFDPLDIEAVFE